MAVLQNDPATINKRCAVLFSSNLLLSFAHRNLVSRELLFPLGQLVYHICRVCPGRKQIKDRFARAALLVDVGDGIADGCSVFGAKLFVDELRTGDSNSVLPQSPNQHKTYERTYGSLHDNSVFVLRNRTVLRLALIEPLAPAQLIPLQQVRQFPEYWILISAKPVTGKLYGVQPCLLSHPLVERVGPLVVLIQGSASLQENQDVFAGQVSVDHHHFQRHQPLEHHLITLKKAAVHVTVDLVGERINDALHPFRRRLDLVGVFD
mmetsp:Transcript_82350/g.197525  ORF Transcript_82350/g.197525 Transcript_82350/m.197525 type:complete len:264 (-) Transcript_82350:5527-6318(-)